MRKRRLIYNGLIILTIATVVSCSNRYRPERGKTIIEDHTHFSHVFLEKRYIRLFLPPDYYQNAHKRYPVIYFFHGFGGRFNGPAEGEQSVSAEARYYDEFNGNIERCGPDTIDNIGEFVRTNEVIVVKWDGFVKEQYPRPYDIGPVKQDMQFTDYFKELVAYIDSSYRTLPNREGRAVSGLSMGGFMAMVVAAKYPHLISSVSAFGPSAGFTIGPKDFQVFTPIKELKPNFEGLPIRIHFGQHDFLRQYHAEIEEAFRKHDLLYESWHYGPNYFSGFHNAVNLKDQFGFHVKHFRMPVKKLSVWHHIDMFPDFEVWGYQVKSNRKIPGFTILENVCKTGFKIADRKWLPDGPSVADPAIDVLTDSLYHPGEKYQVAIAQHPYKTVLMQTIQANGDGRLNLHLTGAPSDIGIYKTGDPGKLSVAEFKRSILLPKSGEIFEITPVLFNKGGDRLKDIRIELISNDARVKVLSQAQIIGKIDEKSLCTQSRFKVIALEQNAGLVPFKLLVNYQGQSDIFRFEIPFFDIDSELVSFRVADGLHFQQEASSKEDSFFGEGNGNGIIEPGERVSFLVQPDKNKPHWYGLKVFSDDPYVDQSMEERKFNNRNDWSGAMRATSELFIRKECPDQHLIRLYGEFDYPAEGNIPRDKQGATSFIHLVKRVSFTVRISKTE
ncbi:MAG: alpha/beta hydrolase [Mangrovibacterium sp.]